MNKLKTFLISSLFIGIISGCTTLPQEEVVYPTSTTRGASLKDLCQRYDVDWQWDSISQVITLKYDGVHASTLVGSNIVLIGEEERIILDDPVKTVRSEVVVPSDFRHKVLERLRKRTSSTTARNYRIKKIRQVVIDAGHGGKDPGAIGISGLQEKKVVLDISKRVKRILEKKGLNVIMTRKKDEFISLQKRTEITSRSKADLFVSIHANSSPSRSAHGVEVFTLKNLNPSEKNEEQRLANHKTLYKNLSMKQNDTKLEKILSEMMYENKQIDSRKLAGHFINETPKFLRAKNRGHKTSRFYVLRNTLVPSVLVEVGFLSNPKEEKLLRSGKYRQKVAYSLALSILDYANQ